MLLLLLLLLRLDLVVGENKLSNEILKTLQSHKKRALSIKSVDKTVGNC